jgi:tetratricopeptide (TPR) repeat protein
MSWRYRKTVRLAPGVRLNLGRRTTGVSVGGHGVRWSANTAGRRTRTVTIPGTGWSNVETSTKKGRAARVQEQPGTFAPRSERAFAQGVALLLGGDPANALPLLKEAARRSSPHGSGADLMAGLCALLCGDAALSIDHLDRVASAGQTLPDEPMQRYAPGAHIELQISPSVSAVVQIDAAAGVLGLAEAQQLAGLTHEAIGSLEALHNGSPSETTCLALCELYAKVDDWDELVALSAGIRPTGEITLATCVLQARALIATGRYGVAVSVLDEVLRSRRKLPELINEARYERGCLHLRLRNVPLARRDLARLYADAPTYRDVEQILRGIQKP